LKRKRILLLTFLTLGSLATVGFAAQSAFSESNGPLSLSPLRNFVSSIVSVERGIYGGEMAIPVNKSQFLKVHQPYSEVTVGNSDIADVEALPDKTIYILGKKIGSTNLTIRNGAGKILSVIDISVTYDISGLKAKMHELAPGDLVEVRPAGESLVLSGRVADAGRLRQLVMVAEQYAPGKVTNMLAVEGSQQVLLKVRFAEVRRSVLKDIGFSNLFEYTKGEVLFSLATGDGLSPEAFGSSIASILSNDFSVLNIIDLLEEKGMVRTLAEPNIIALSGDNATFLAGGEFPIPVAQSTESGNTTITVEYKKFGVGLSFTPTVIGKDTINLVMDAEVSSIDPTVSVTTSGLTIPGLKMRRSNTTVELRDGQSFAIAGLIEDNFEDTVRAIPGLAGIPIIGQLASSKDFLRRQTELVIIIEAHLVQPTIAQALSVPTDRTVPPSDAALFMMGKTEGEAVLNEAAGIDGPYGYILP